MKFFVEFFDATYIKDDTLHHIVFNKCDISNEDSPTGFRIVRLDQKMIPQTVAFISIEHAFEYFKKLSNKIENEKDLVFLDMKNMCHKYGFIYNQYRMNRISESMYKHLEKFYSQYMHDDIMNSIKYLVDLDVENRLKGTEWQGYWRRIKRGQFRLFINNISNKEVIQHEKIKQPYMEEKEKIYEKHKEKLNNLLFF